MPTEKKYKSFWSFYPYYLTEHSHMHEQVAQVLKGRFQLTIDGNLIELEPGKVVVIPSNTKHSGVALTDCTLLDVFSPVREDYKF